MNLRFVYRYILSLSKKNKTKQNKAKQTDQTKGKKSLLRRESNSGPSKCEANMRRINYDSATVNISFLFGQRNISFRNDISFTTNHEIGSLAVRKVENHENRELGPAWESQSNAIADLFVMFIASTSQKASKVHKLLSQSWP